jgi:transcriptional regulator with XRE-family HTH domain
MGHEHVQTVLKAFKGLLADLPMSQAELASQIGVAHTTVGRWARGQTTPALADMIRAVEAITNRLDDLKRRADRSESALKAIQSTQKAWDSGDLHEFAMAMRRAEEALNELADL